MSSYKLKYYNWTYKFNKNIENKLELISKKLMMKQWKIGQGDGKN